MRSCECGCGVRVKIRFACGHNKRLSKIIPTDQRFWKMVNKSGDCWTWLGTKKPTGYGSFKPLHEKTIGAHRYSWWLHFGVIPKGLHVLHRCDNPSCVNPSHLFLGTARENMADKLAKGRQPRGSVCSFSKLDELKVKEIRILYSIDKTLSYKALAKRFGVSYSAIHRCVKGHDWKHV